MVKSLPNSTKILSNTSINRQERKSLTEKKIAKKVADNLLQPRAEAIAYILSKTKLLAN
jgi:hypothetical protein